MRKKLPVESWYEIEEWIPPENARGNVPFWTPCREANGRLVYRETSIRAARKMLASIESSRKFRLVKVTREVIAEKL